jgi:rhodanese-related sulfurtransferase
MTQTTPQIDLDMTMEEVMEKVPAAQRALFQRFHVGGCSSCGFQPSDTLRKVCKDHNLLDTQGVVDTILEAHDLDGRVECTVEQVRDWLEAGEDFSFVDVRTPDEWDIARIEGTELLDYSDPGRYMELPKERRIVFTCHTGGRSLDVASYFLGHGFTQVNSMAGGIEAWSQRIDSSVPRY